MSNSKLEQLAEMLMVAAKSQKVPMVIMLGHSDGDKKGLAVLKTVSEKPVTPDEVITTELLERATALVQELAESPKDLIKDYVMRHAKGSLAQAIAAAAVMAAEDDEERCDCPFCSASH